MGLVWRDQGREDDFQEQFVLSQLDPLLNVAAPAAVRLSNGFFALVSNKVFQTIMPRSDGQGERN